MARLTYTANQLTPAAWMGDPSEPARLLPGGAKVDPAQFFREDSVLVKLSAAAAADAVSISVDALSGPIPAGTLLHFGESKEFARTTAAVAAGAVAIPVEALPAAIEDNDEARYAGTNTQFSIQNGTVLGRTYAERDAGTAYGPAADADDEIYLLAFDVTDASINNDCELYRHGGIVKENFLPVFSTLSATLKGKIRAAYECVRGVD